MTDFTITPFPAALGAEVTGLDLSRPLDEAAFARLRQAFETHSVLALRDQHATPAEHIDFSRRFGPLEIHVQHHFHLAGHPEILIVSNVVENGRNIGLADAGKYWHSDLSYMGEPSLGSLLHAQELPASGGDTLFASTAAAYDALTDVMKRRIAGLDAVHDYAARNRAQQAKSSARPGLTAEQLSRVPPVVHPMVRVHPATGRRCLFVNEGFTTAVVGLAPAESDALLAELFAHMTEARFQYRHRWRPHDLVMWDNRAALHLATGTPEGSRRTLYRTTIRGEVPRRAPMAPAGA
jgi:taurine dioxygenase